MRRLELPEDYTVVLLKLKTDGTDDYTNLVESLRFDRLRLAHIVRSLQHKGLISLRGNGTRGFWVSLSAKGQRFMSNPWPEVGLRPSY